MKALLLLLLALLAAPDEIVTTMTQGSIQNLSGKYWVTIDFSATSSKGVIIHEIWDCDNGSLTFGQNPPAGPLASPVVLQGTFPDGSICGYDSPGTYEPTVKVVDSLGKTANASLVLIIQ
jgi:hypothetical protein